MGPKSKIARVRPARSSDLDAFMRLAHTVGNGMTSMPADADVLGQRLAASEARLRDGPDAVSGEALWFVLELGDEVVGSAAIFPEIGLDWPFYSFKRSKLTNRSTALGKSVVVETLTMNNDLCGMAEVGGLVVLPEARRGGAGRLAAQSRYMFMATHRPWFPDSVIAEMRGFLDEEGRSPVWEALGRPFYGMDFPDADRFGAVHGNQFIAELGPKHTIYVDLLSERARNCVGRAHVESSIALGMLIKEGFQDRGYCDIFDGGPQVMAQVDNLAVVKTAALRTITSVTRSSVDGTSCLLASGTREKFLTLRADAKATAEGIEVGADVATALDVRCGDEVMVSDPLGVS